MLAHVPIPAAALVCSPPADGQYAASCGELPWVVTAENSSTGGGGAEVPAPTNACTHDVCEEGGNLNAECSDTCVAQVSAADDYCCSNAWDNLCVDAVADVCGQDCTATGN